MPGKISFEVNLGTSGDARAGMLRRSDTLRMLVLGDFSGRRHRGPETATALADRPILRVDLDNFDAVFQRLSPGLTLGSGIGGSSGIAVQFETLEDFHPDRLFAALEPFAKLRESRSRLLDPASFEQEAARLMEGSVPTAEAGDMAPARDPPRPEDQANLLQRLMGAPVEATARPASPKSLVDGLVRRLVEPHIKPGSSRSPAPTSARSARSTRSARNATRMP